MRGNGYHAGLPLDVLKLRDADFESEKREFATEAKGFLGTRVRAAININGMIKRTRTVMRIRLYLVARDLSRAATIGLFAMAQLSIPSRAQKLVDQQSLCDPEIVKDRSAPNGYRDRGDRCEGLLPHLVNATEHVELVSLQDAISTGRIQPEEALTLSWTKVGPLSKSASVRVQSLKRDVRYRMDTRRNAATRQFQWPSDLPAVCDLQVEDIGFIVSTRAQLLSAERVVYLPASLASGNGSASAARGTIRATLIPHGVTISNVFISLGRIDADGSLKMIVQDKKTLVGPYTKETAVPVELPQATSGFYFANIVVELTSGVDEPLPFYFYYDGR